MVHAAYEPRRPNKGGNQRKLKFWATATCVCAARNDKRSIGLSIKETPTKGLTPIGNVTIPSGGSLFQPQFMRVRDDIERADSLADLKFKRENSDSDDE